MKLFILFLFLPLILHAESELPIPEKGIDTELLEMKTPRRFFADRKTANAGCVTQLRNAETAYHRLRNELKESKRRFGAQPTEEQKDALDAKEREMRDSRSEQLRLVEICGDCATRPVLYRRENVAGQAPEHRYSTDGSCQLTETDAAKLRTALEKASGFLLDTRHYNRQQSGFYSVLDCFGIDANNGRKPYEVIADLPYRAFMAVKGPLGQSFNYAMNVRPIPATVADVNDDFHLTFTGTEAPRALQNDVKEVFASGREVRTNPYALKKAAGSWYLTRDGYFRYYTIADFRIPSFTVLNSFARTTLLDTVLNLTERSTRDDMQP